jgi:hypothetical protein
MGVKDNIKKKKKKRKRGVRSYWLRLPQTGSHSTLFVRAPIVKNPVGDGHLSRHSNYSYLHTESALSPFFYFNICNGPSL